MLSLVILPVTMGPTISALGLWVSLQIKNLNLASPDGLTAKDPIDKHGFVPNRVATMQLHYLRFKAAHLFATTFNEFFNRPLT
jgi:hypothetical protein